MTWGWIDRAGCGREVSEVSRKSWSERADDEVTLENTLLGTVTPGSGSGPAIVGLEPSRGRPSHRHTSACGGCLKPWGG